MSPSIVERMVKNSKTQREDKDREHKCIREQCTGWSYNEHRDSLEYTHFDKIMAIATDVENQVKL